MIYEDFVRTLLARMGLPYEIADAGAARDGVDRLVRLSAMVDDLIAEAGYDTLFDTREKCLEALRQDIKAKLGTAPVDRETLARAIWDASVKADRRPEWHLLAADVALRLIRPAPAAKVVDQEGLAKLLYNPHGGAAVAWEHKSEAARSHFRDMAAAALKYIGAASAADDDIKNRQLFARVLLHERDKLLTWDEIRAKLCEKIGDFCVVIERYKDMLKTANEEMSRAESSLRDEVARRAELATEIGSLRTQLADAQVQVGVWRDAAKTQKKMRLDLAVEQDKLVAALDEAQNQLAAERRKWPELKADVERLREANRELADALVARKPLDRDRIRLALLDFDPKVNTVGFINDLADHLVKKLA